jgi:hypothetical protein
MYGMIDTSGEEGEPNCEQTVFERVLRKSFIKEQSSPKNETRCFERSLVC